MQNIKINPIIWDDEKIPHESDVTDACTIMRVCRHQTDVERGQPIIIDGVRTIVTAQIWSGCGCGKRHYTYLIEV